MAGRKGRPTGSGRLRPSRGHRAVRVDPGGRAPVQQTAQDRGRSSGGLGGTETGPQTLPSRQRQPRQVLTTLKQLPSELQVQSEEDKMSVESLKQADAF